MRVMLTHDMARRRATADQALVRSVSEARMAAAAATPALQELAYLIKAARARAVLDGTPCPFIAEEAALRGLGAEALARAILDAARADEDALLATELERVRARLAIARAERPEDLPED